MVFAHLAGTVGNEVMAVVESDAETGVGQHFHHHAIHFKQFFFGHGRCLRNTIETGNPGKCRACRCGAADLQ